MTSTFNENTDACFEEYDNPVPERSICNAVTPVPLAESWMDGYA
jgi:hypothetical protein